MKRRISAILLLLTFLGTMAHDMIPHHHHDSDSEVHAEHYDVQHSTCSNSHSEVYKLLVDECDQHQCTHQFHNCIYRFYEASRAGTTISNVLVCTCILCSSSLNNLVVDNTKANDYNLGDKHNYYKSISIVHSGLRGPPHIV